MEEFLTKAAANLYWLLTWSPVVTAAISIFFGLLWCFFGYRIFRPLLVTTIGLFGGLIGASCAAVASASIIAWIIGGLIGALVGGVCGYVFVYVSVFLLGMNFATGGAFLLFTTVGKMPQNSALFAALVVGAAGGLIALLMMRPLLIIYTALTGALWVVASVVDLIIGTPSSVGPQQWNLFYSLNVEPFVRRYWPILAGCVLLLAIFGAAYQFVTERGKDKQGASEAKPGALRRAKAAA